MKKLFENKALGFFFGLGSGVVGLVTAIFYLIYSTSVNHFNFLVFALLVLSVVAEVFVVLVNNEFLTFLPTIGFSVAFAAYAVDRVIMFEEMINGIYGMSESGAILPIVVALLILEVVCVLLSLVQVFGKRDRVTA